MNLTTKNLTNINKVASEVHRKYVAGTHVGEVFSKEKCGKKYLSARITDDNGKRVGKVMSVEKHGYENCLRVLSDWLDLKKIEFGYGINHGK